MRKSRKRAPWKWGPPWPADHSRCDHRGTDLAVLAEDAVTDQQETPRFGVEREVSVGLDNAGSDIEKTVDLACGHSLSRGDGHRPDARQLDVPEGAALFIWNQDRTQFLGSFTEANEKDWGFLPIGRLDDDQIVVEYQEPSVHGQGDVSISQIVHGYRSLLPHPQSPAANEANMGPLAIQVLNINVNCPEGARQTSKKSVAPITNGGFAVCSGPWSTTPEDGTPYFPTANHSSKPNSWLIISTTKAAPAVVIRAHGPKHLWRNPLVNSGASDAALIELSSASCQL